MEKKIVNANIEPNVLADSIIRYLEEMDFDVVEVKTEAGYQIRASDSPHYKVGNSIVVNIEGKSGEFSVDLNLCHETKNEHFQFPLMLLTMFGGGAFVLRRLHADQAWVDFKVEFWKQLHRLIENPRRSDEHRLPM
jgi:hypothetical protein